MLNKWHGWLGMSKFDRAWHERDLADELLEYYDETHLLKKWSELSDVVYTTTRGRWSGHDIEFPLKSWQYHVGVVYMLPKMTGRYLFFRRAGKKAGADKPIRNVRNPKKLYKLDEILEEQDIKVDKAKLIAICERQRRYWPLLP